MFEITPENIDEVYDKYLKLSTVETNVLASSEKKRLYFTKEQLQLLQNCIQIALQTADYEFGGLHDERDLMQMGYMLEDVKSKFKS